MSALSESLLLGTEQDLMNVQVTAEEEELLLRSPRRTKRKERRAKLKK
jgi:hypothetical protein